MKLKNCKLGARVSTKDALWGSGVITDVGAIYVVVELDDGEFLTFHPSELRKEDPK